MRGVVMVGLDKGGPSLPARENTMSTFEDKPVKHWLASMVRIHSILTGKRYLLARAESLSALPK